MKSFLKFFATIIGWFTDLLSWLFSVPGIVISAVYGLYSAVRAFYDSIFVGNSYIDPLLNGTQTAVENFTQYLNGMPDLVKLVLYCLSMDVFADFILHTYGVFIAFFVALIVFLIKAIPAYVGVFFGLKYSAKLICAVLPSGYCPQILVRNAGSRLLAQCGILSKMKAPI